MEKKEFYTKLRGLMIPIAFQNFMLAAVSAGDSAMLGFVDENAMAAVSLAGNIQFVENLFLGALICGATILTAQYWGNKDKGTVERLFGLTLRYSVVISGIFCIAAFCCPKFLISLFTNEAGLIDIGSDYVKIASASYFLTGITQSYLCLMKTTGQTKQSAAISSFALALDTVLNVIFIFGFHLGAVGAALTTTVSRLVELLITLIYSGKMKVKPSFRGVSSMIRKDFWSCSIPHLINSMVWGIGTTLYSVIIGHLGAVMVAASSVATIVRQLALSVCHGLGQGGEILLAGVLGTGDFETGREYGRRLSKLSVLCGIFCAGLALLFGTVLSGCMTLSSEVRETLNIMIWISGFYMLAQCINVVVVCGVFVAGGDVKFDAYSVAVTMWLVILPLAAVAAFILHWEPMTVYFILSLDEIVKIPWVYAHYKKYKWLNKMTREETL